MRTVLLSAVAATAFVFGPTVSVSIDTHDGPAITVTTYDRESTGYTFTGPDADEPTFATLGDCSTVDWLAQDGDGVPFVPVDLNGDGYIDCDSDLELGA